MKDLVKKFFQLIMILGGVLWSVAVFAQSVAVYPFIVNGPSDAQYLSTAVQDAIIGSLAKSGFNTVALTKSLDPDRLNSAQTDHGKYSLVVAGRINVVGHTYRVLLKWANNAASGKIGQEYLEVSGINELIPQVETFAKNRLPAESVSLAEASSSVSAQTTPPLETIEKKKPPKLAPVSAPKTSPSPTVEKVVMKKEKEPKQAPLSFQGGMIPAGDYEKVSSRVPFQVRSMAFGDVNRDDSPEILLTGDSELHLYRWNDGQLQELGDWRGNRLDHFVKVDLWPQPSEDPSIVLTVLRGSQAMSQILKWNGSSFQVIAQDIPYQLRVAGYGHENFLLGEVYHAKQTSKHQIYRMKLEGREVKPESKLDLPPELDLYSFDWVGSHPDGSELMGLTPLGKLQYFRLEGSKYKRVWSSRESYGGSSNDVPVEVKDFFNEVVADYYLVPMTVQNLPGSNGVDVLVAKNDAILKNIVGRTPLVTDGHLIRLRSDQIGFGEVWQSRKLDGSISDFKIIDQDGQRQALTAVRLRNPGLLGDVGKHDSIILVYELN